MTATTKNTEMLRKLRLFKLTITVCIVYALVSLAILGVIYITEKGATFVEESNFPFAITFTIGVLLIIGIMIYKVLRFKEAQFTSNTYDDTTCPDFWKLEKTPTNVLNAYQVQNRPGKEYRCVKEGEMEGSNTVNVPVAATDRFVRQVAEVSRSMTTATMQQGVPSDQVKVDCTKLYPTYMSLYDVKTNPDTQNAMRCAYATTCGIPWSSICP